MLKHIGPVALATFLASVLGGTLTGCTSSTKVDTSETATGGGAGEPGTGGDPGALGGGGGNAAGAGAATNGGAHTGGECQPGAVGCDGLVPQLCGEDELWSASRAACAIACTAGACAACEEGARDCRDGAVQRCDGGEWTTREVCEANCEDGRCTTNCTPDRLQCDGDQRLTRCNGTEYVEEELCEFVCAEGACVGECLPDSQRCEPDADNVAQSCNSLGQWDQSVPCGTDTFCVDGECKPCEPGSTRCDVGGPQLCNEAGEWVPEGACSAPTPICVAGACAACEPGVRRCSGNLLEECASDGSGWTTAETCSGDNPACIESTQSCGRCQLGERQCSGDTVQECNDVGSWVHLTSCAMPTPACFDGACRACNPTGAPRRCLNGSTPQECGSDGSWVTLSRCSGTTPECLPTSGACVECVSGTRSCGDCDGGEQTCENNHWGPCVGGTVDLMTDENNCGICTRTCTSSQTCDSGSCVCTGGTHGCGAPNPCFPDDDGAHCGDTCLDCSSYHGTTGSCANDQCVCETYDFGCAGGEPNCASWNFETGSEGWRLGTFQDSTSKVIGSPTVRLFSGSHWLAADYLTAGGQGTATFAVDLCIDQETIGLQGKVLTWNTYISSSAPAPDPLNASIANHTDSVVEPCQPILRTGEVTQLRCAFPGTFTRGFQTLQLSFALPANESGTVLIDNVRFE